MKQLIFFDPSISSANMADNFITQICYSEIQNLFPNHIIVKLSSHNEFDDFAKFRMSNAEFAVIGGTGIMSNCLPGKENFQWKTEHNDLTLPIIGMGIGFENKGMDLKPELKEFYKRIFGDDVISVRGEYTKEILRDIDVNCVNTGCPSLWNFKSFGKTKGRNVVFNMNSYRKVNHREYYEVLKEEYENVFFYAQHYIDVETIRQEIPEWEPVVVPCNFEPLAEFCIANNCDFIGTRVHSSIYLLNQQVRSIVINTDCRTEEVVGQAGLPLANTPDELRLLINKNNYFSLSEQAELKFKTNKRFWMEETSVKYGGA